VCFIGLNAAFCRLGLSLAVAIIQAHGGRMSAEDAPEGGAIARFKRPLQYRAAG
jgi:K+-sensing histidine kinase KdpD